MTIRAAMLLVVTESAASLEKEEEGEVWFHCW